MVILELVEGCLPPHEAARGDESSGGASATKFVVVPMWVACVGSQLPVTLPQRHALHYTTLKRGPNKLPRLSLCSAFFGSVVQAELRNL